MKRIALSMLVIAMVLGIGFSAMAGEQLRKETMDVKLNIPKYAMVTVPESLELELPSDLEGDGEGIADFNVKSNCSVRLTVESRGFLWPFQGLNDWVSYDVSVRSLLWPITGSGSAGEQVFSSPLLWTLGLPRSGRLTAKASWDKDYWTHYHAGDYRDKLTFTVAAWD